MQLTAIEARVLGSLIEKEITTPEYYPLSLNALLAACNQKSSREPAMQVKESDVREALRTLEDKDLVTVDHGSRVQRYENRARTVFQLRRDETAVLCLLLLRGPQTPGELRSRADRLFTFDDIPAVLGAIQRLSTPLPETPGRALPLVAALPRQPGSREQRFIHLLSEMAIQLSETALPPLTATPAMDRASGEREQLPMETTAPEAGTQRLPSPEAATAGLQATIAGLETTTAGLEAAVTQLQNRMQSLEKQLGIESEARAET